MTEQPNSLSQERRKWLEQVSKYINKTIKTIEVTNEWTNFTFTDGSLLSFRDEPEYLELMK